MQPWKCAVKITCMYALADIPVLFLDRSATNANKLEYTNITNYVVQLILKVCYW